MCSSIFAHQEAALSSSTLKWQMSNCAEDWREMYNYVQPSTNDHTAQSLFPPLLLNCVCHPWASARSKSRSKKQHGKRAEEPGLGLVIACSKSLRKRFVTSQTSTKAWYHSVHPVFLAATLFHANKLCCMQSVFQITFDVLQPVLLIASWLYEICFAL